MSVALAAAIQAGNVQKAQELASALAQSHTRVSVNFDAASQEKKAREQEIRSVRGLNDLYKTKTKSKTGCICDLLILIRVGIQVKSSQVKSSKLYYLIII